MPEAIERVKPSIVAVGAYSKQAAPPFAYRGTGFVVGDGTLVATNAHVVPEPKAGVPEAATVVLAFPGSGEPQVRSATPVARDAAHDLVLLRISGAPLPALDLHGAAPVREGQVFAFTGFPIGGVLGLVPVTHRAMVSAVTPIAIPGASARSLDSKVIRSIKSGPFPVLQLDATAYPGNSGSPLYDIESGRVVGVINLVFVKGTKEAVLSQPSGISFAVPVRYLQQLLDSQR